MANALIGTALLLIGRKLYWIFIGGIGFISGYYIATQYIQSQSELIVVIIGLLAGLIGILLAHFFQRWAIGIAAFGAGGYLAIELTRVFRLSIGGSSWVLYLIGGVFGVILTSVLFDWALIFLSTFTGATLITTIIHPNQLPQRLVFIILLIIGISIQCNMYKNENK